MQHATVTHDGETLSVPIKNIQLPSGHRMLAPNEVPEGLFDQDDLDAKIEKRLERQKQKLQENMPSEGDVVLTGDEAQRYTALEGTDDAEPLEAIQKSEKQARTSLADAERNEELRDFAGKTGANFDALKAHADGETFEVRTEEDDDGNEIERGYVVPEGEDAEAVPVEEYGRFEHVRLFDESDDDQGGGNDDDTMVTQTSATKNKRSTSKSDEELQKEKQRSGDYSPM